MTKRKGTDQRVFWQDLSTYPKEDVLSFGRRSYNKMKKLGVKSVLELGCGIGGDALYFAQKGMNVIAVDFSRAAINELKKTRDKEGLDSLVCRIKDFTKPWDREIYVPGSVDAVFANQSLHYFDSSTTQKVLSYIHQTLKPEGILFACVFSALHNNAGKGENVENGLQLINGQLQRFFSTPCLKKYLNGSFEIVTLDYAMRGKDKTFLEVTAKKMQR